MSHFVSHLCVTLWTRCERRHVCDGLSCLVAVADSDPVEADEAAVGQVFILWARCERQHVTLCVTVWTGVRGSMSHCGAFSVSPSGKSRWHKLWWWCHCAPLARVLCCSLALCHNLGQVMGRGITWCPCCQGQPAR
jgi:hypothetical protein